ncbi:MAG: arylsulfatase A-like enzyme [Planctomycetota bacterium]|jgi:arylsulfatase A-like enzyme
MSLLRPALLAWPLVSLSLLVGCTESSSSKPNVLLLSLDSVRADRVSASGYRPDATPDVLTTPNIDRLAEDGVIFDNAFSTTSWTLPSHMAMFTGLPDEMHGVIDNDRTLDPALTTLTELLHDNGWTTGGFYSGPYLNPIFGFGQGFDHYVNCGTVVPDEVFDDDEMGRWREIHQFSHETITSPSLYEQASDWIREAADSDQPFFAMVHWWDPHYDYKAPEEYTQLFETNYTGEWSGLRMEDVRKPVDAPDVAYILSLYDAELRFTDDFIGRLLDVLDELDVADNTLVIVTSDHGEEFYERTRWGHQRSLFDEVLRVPLVMRFPKHIPAGTRVAGQARLQDIYPTVAELLSLAPPRYLTGKSLKTLWDQPSNPGFEQELFMLVPHREIHVSGLRSPTEKVLWDFTASKGSYWNLVKDPLEHKERPFGEKELNSGLHPAIERLRVYLDQVEAARAKLPQSQGHGRIELNETMQQELEDLGYTGDDDDVKDDDVDEEQTQSE